ncbi:putative inactive leucine-rich repeat receptor-like protein kinase [Cinnamomum micranthum f. kanehirae]|uniref:Putative inactive leucine-rich repeat receptor-like protein kinase n=1 Tax=Cinnamomum micranthum f. kanehirae TaxID=337451 RepID=A0A443NE65_9MAGN|nr:putative inactive leucine-rich repeat receptor-like protein kinase [Cinnamomum micranthum f. kanehirae]
MKGSYILVVVVSLLSCFVECEGCLKEERWLLLQFKSSINPPNGSNGVLDEWKGGRCCKWRGVECNNSSRVFRLFLIGTNSRMDTARTWYPNITILAQLKELKELYLDDNQIGGSDTLQAFCELQKLTLLELSSNSLEGNIPQCMGNMHSLELLQLSDNHLHGTISPSTFSGMHSLQYLDLSGNQLQGTISPSTFSNMHSLGLLRLSSNQLEGTISPLTFSNLTMIQDLSLSDNKFTGLFPLSMIANISRLLSLDLSNNYQLEVETESPTWVPRFQLFDVNVANCKVNKRSGSNIPSFIFTQRAIVSLDLSNTSLGGVIPSWLFYNFTRFRSISLRSNSLNGPFPLPPQNTTSLLDSLDISKNHVYGPVPVHFSNIFPLLTYCDMSTNALQGKLPSTMGTEKLEVLFLHNNFFSGEIPPSLMRNMTSLEHLVLSNNKLQGEMILEDSTMDQLVSLKLDGNEFTIPPNISKTPWLQILDIRNNHLSGNISSWLPVLTKLHVLFLGGNHFEGSIPWQICQMRSLQYLDLSNTNLGGTIPSCLATVPSWETEPGPYDDLDFGLWNGRIAIDIITKGILYNYTGVPLHWMTSIDLSLNKLTGTIPFELGNMTAVRALNLSHNLLEGPIPTSFQNMKDLESLDLSHNNLIGRIPQEITKLNFLTTLTLAFNNLSGEIPYQGKFFTFSGSSFEGNPGLCGKPLTINCSSDIPLNPNDEKRGGGGEEEHGILDNDLFFYSCLAISYCMGFWGVIAFLFFNKDWRRKLFTTMDAVQDWCFGKCWRVMHFFTSRFCKW